MPLLGCFVLSAVGMIAPSFLPCFQIGDSHEVTDLIMDIYVGNLPYDLDESALREVFTPYGTVDKIHIVFDKISGRSKGFAFVSMPNGEEAQKAIESVDGTEIAGRAVKVNEARPREQSPAGGGFGAPRPPRPFNRGGSGGGGRGPGGGGDRRGGFNRGGGEYRDSRGGDSRGGDRRGGY